MLKDVDTGSSADGNQDLSPESMDTIEWWDWQALHRCPMMFESMFIESRSLGYSFESINQDCI